MVAIAKHAETRNRLVICHLLFATMKQSVSRTASDSFQLNHQSQAHSTIKSALVIRTPPRRLIMRSNRSKVARISVRSARRRARLGLAGARPPSWRRRPPDRGSPGRPTWSPHTLNAGVRTPSNYFVARDRRLSCAAAGPSAPRFAPIPKRRRIGVRDGRRGWTGENLNRKGCGR